MKRGVAVAALCGLVSACTGFQAVEGNMPVQVVGSDITVVPQVAWSQATNKTSFGQLWTIDGIGLDELRFYTGIRPGAPLMPVPGVQQRDLGKYDSSMLPNDVMELLVSTLNKAGHQQIRTEALRPAPFGSLTGFRFDFSFANRDGLEMKGMALAAQRNGRLDLILFTAPAEYYFERHAPTVERIFASIQIPQTQARAGAS